jgi:hypothetical protein
MTVPVFEEVQYSEIRAASSTLQETACEDEERMDERQQHLAAAAEAMRTWIHKQRAMWAEGYPQNLLHQAQPQLAAASAVAIVSPSAFIAAPETTAADPWAPRESGPSWWQGIADHFGSMLQGTTTFVQTSWRMLAGIAVIVMVAGAVRFAWPGVKDKMSSNLATGREAVKTQTQALSQKVGGNRPAVTTTKVSAAAKGTGQLQVESSPTGARVQIDGKDRGVTPLTIEGLASGSHKVVIRGDAGSVQRTVSIAAGELLQLSESIYSGWLHVAAPFEIQLSEGRRSITLDDSNQVLLAPGPHDVRFENRTFGLREVRHLEIRPGETTAVSLELPVSHLTVTASEPATVAIDGQPVGETPLGEYAVPVGTRDVTVTSATGQVHHQTITMKVQPARIDVDFSKP